MLSRTSELLKPLGTGINLPRATGLNHLVAGIDPGYRTLGWAVLDFTDVRHPRWRGGGVLRTRSGGELGQRVDTMIAAVARIEVPGEEGTLAEVVEGMAIERYEYHRGRSGLVQSEGVNLVIGGLRRLPWQNPPMMFSAAEARAAITGQRRSGKVAGAYMLRQLVAGVPVKLADHATDAGVLAWAAAQGLGWR